MERQDLVENVLRLYVWIMDQKLKAKNEGFAHLDIGEKAHWTIAENCFDEVKVYIEDHFRPLV